MAMFTKDEAFEFIKNFLQIENAEQRMLENRRRLLDDIILNIQSKLPFQSVSLLSRHPTERRKPTLDEVKSNFLSGIGGLCFELNICTFYLLSAIGFDVLMTHASVASTIHCKNNHVSLLIRNLEKEGDHFLADVACGHPTFQAISLDFERESPIFIDSYLEYKLVKYDGVVLRMHRTGDMLAMNGKKPNSVIEFWLDDWRRFISYSMEGTKDVREFNEYHDTVYTKPDMTPFHRSLRVVTFTGGKAAMVADEKTLIENDRGQLVKTPLSGGDEGIISAVKEICPVIPEELLQNALLHWRQTISHQ